MTHEIALDKATMTYSWHNISDQYQNNQIKYSPDGGTSWETVKFVDGMYTCLLYTSPSPRDGLLSRMPSSA